jgi:hypothetical protein
LQQITPTSELMNYAKHAVVRDSHLPRASLTSGKTSRHTAPSRVSMLSWPSNLVAMYSNRPVKPLRAKNVQAFSLTSTTSMIFVMPNAQPSLPQNSEVLTTWIKLWPSTPQPNFAQPMPFFLTAKLRRKSSRTISMLTKCRGLPSSISSM